MGDPVCKIGARYVIASYIKNGNHAEAEKTIKQKGGECVEKLRNETGNEDIYLGGPYNECPAGCFGSHSYYQIIDRVLGKPNQD